MMIKQHKYAIVSLDNIRSSVFALLKSSFPYVVNEMLTSVF